MATMQDIEAAPAVMSIALAIKLLGIKKQRGYQLLHDGNFPVRTIRDGERQRVSKHDLLRHLGMTE